MSYFTSHIMRYIWAYIALIPMGMTAIFAYLGTILWSIQISFTSSKLLPKYDYVGFDQYQRLFESARWLTAVENMLIIAILFIFISLIIGFLLAVFLDQHIRAEGLFRAIFLYPYAMSFIVTGIIWQWILNPQLGLEKTFHNLGWTAFQFDWLVDRNMVVYALVIAAVWQAAGLVMALFLAGLRGIDEDIWKAAKIDNIPPWRVYISIILPMLKPVLITILVLLFLSVVKMYDIVVAMTQGGPGNASDVPAKFILDHLFERANIGLATAASTTMLICVFCALLPILYVKYLKSKSHQKV